MNRYHFHLVLLLFQILRSAIETAVNSKKIDEKNYVPCADFQEAAPKNLHTGHKNNDGKQSKMFPVIHLCLYRQDFNPIVIRIVNEVQAHRFVLITDAA